MNRSFTSNTPVSNHQNIEILPNQLLFSITKGPLKQSSQQKQKESFYFSIDANPEFQYLPFYYDFGPPSLLQIHKFYNLVNTLIKSHPNSIIHYTCSTHPNHVANGVLFISSYRMISLKIGPDEAYAPCAHLSSILKPFRDASTMPCLYDLTVISSLRGLHHAMQLGWFDVDSFDAEEWNKNEQVQNGDMNWIIPNKMLAFATPYANNILPGGWRVATPNDLVPTFKKLGITLIIRLCEKFYNEKIFTHAGFKHNELYFLDGSNPPMNIREKFLEYAEKDNIIALHCKAGLGRTGTLIGCYLIKDYNFTAHEAIGWIRICRPGSIIGPQQKYLISYADKLNKSAPSKSTPAMKPSTATTTSDSTKSTKSHYTSTKLGLLSSSMSLESNTVQQPAPQPKPETSTKHTTSRSTTSSSKTRGLPPPSPSSTKKTTSTKKISPASPSMRPTTTSTTKPRESSSSKKLGDQSSYLSVKSTVSTPYYPQPRKEKRAAALAAKANSSKK